MNDNFRNWVKDKMASDSEVTSEQAEIFSEAVEELPADDLDASARKLIAERKRGKGMVVTSRHPYNMFIDLKKLFERSVPAVAAAVDLVSASDPVSLGLAMYGALLAVRNLTELMDVELSDDHAQVVLWLWNDRMSKDWVFKSDLEDAIKGRLSEHTLDEILIDLESMRTIEIDESDAIWKIEYLEVKG